MSTEVTGESIQIKQEKDDQEMVTVKQEPVDPDDVTSTNRGPVAKSKDLAFSDHLRQQLENHGKDLTLQKVLEDLLQGKNHTMVESIVASYTGNTANGNNNETGKKATGSDKNKSATDARIVEVEALTSEDISVFVDHVFAVKSVRILRSVNYRDRFEAYGTQKFMCNFCKFETDREHVLVNHVDSHKFNCEFCSYQTFLRTKLISHCLKEHPKFKESAKDLTYCVNQKDAPTIKGKNMKKRTAGDSTTIKSEPSKRKRVCLSADENDSTGSLDMEVEEVDEDDKSSVLNSTDVEFKKELFSYPNNIKSEKELAPAQSSGETEVLPVITNVISGHQAVSEATGEPGEDIQQKTEDDSASAVGSSDQALPPPDLYWNCGYCDFVTLDRQHLKCHLFARHNGKVHKYVAMLVSSQEELDRIKVSDEQLTKLYGNGQHININKQPESDKTPSSSTVVPSTPAEKPPVTEKPKATSPPKSKKTYGIEIDNAESDSPQKSENLEYQKSIPSSYKCALCNFNSTETKKIKGHIFSRHVGSVLYVIDMKAVKLGKKRYVFLCMNPKCDYETKIVQEFLDHAEACTPWLDKEKVEGVDPNLVKSLKATTDFIKKSLDSVDNKAKDFNPGGGVEQYSCKFCSYMAPNNTRLKKHNITVHTNKMTVFRDNFSEKNKLDPNVYFCRHCLWETRDPPQLELHLEKNHPDAPPQPTVKSTSASQSANKSTDKETNNKPAKQAATNDTGKKRASPSSDEDLDTDKSGNLCVIAQYESLIPKATFEKAVEELISSEESVKKKRGRPMRRAAAIVELQKRSDPLPPLYQCFHCNMVQFGIALMRRHLTETHRGKPLCANDVLKINESSLKAAKTLFCSKKDCLFSAPTIEDMDKHTNSVHLKVNSR